MPTADAPDQSESPAEAQHYFSAEPAGSAARRTVAFTIAGREYSLVSSGGVFSSARLDSGTSVLLRKAPLPGTRGGTFLDLGCGYGPIAAVLATTSPAAIVYAVDVNTRALELVRENAVALGVAERVTASTPPLVPDNLRFDEIWSNPPIRVGKPELHAMLTQWLPRLRPGGTAWLVVARYLGADSLQEWLRRGGWPTTRDASANGYRVLRVDAPDGDVTGVPEVGNRS